MANRSNMKTPLPLGLTPRTLFVTGKGGVGKTTVAAALAIAYRNAGIRTLLVEIEGQHGAASLISPRAVGYEPVALAQALWAMKIDSQHAIQDYARLAFRVRAVADRLVRNPVVTQFTEAAPGLKELLVLGKIWHMSKQVKGNRPQYEAIIVDAPATGHGLGLLGMAGTVARAFPVGPIAQQARSVDEFVKDSARTGTILVTLPEELPVTEALEMREKLGRQDVDVAGVVVNSVLPERLEDDDVRELRRLLDGASDHVGAAVNTALYHHQRVQDQRSSLVRLDRAAPGAYLLPFLYTDELGKGDVDTLASKLARGRETAAKRIESDAAPAGAARS